MTYGVSYSVLVCLGDVTGRHFWRLDAPNFGHCLLFLGSFLPFYDPLVIPGSSRLVGRIRLLVALPKVQGLLDFWDKSLA